jgi:tight adherence protein B
MTTLAWSVLAGLCGGIGLLALITGLRGEPQHQPPSPSAVDTRIDTPAPTRMMRTWWVPSRRSLTAAAAGMLAWWATGWPVAALAAAAAVLGVPALLHPSRPREALDRLDALTSWTRRVADLLASGAGGLEQALAYTVATTGPPLQQPVDRLVRRLPAVGLEAALRDFAADVDDPAADEIVASLVVRARAGGRGLAAVLHSQAAAMAAEATARRQVETDRATPRAAVRSLVWITLIMLVGLVVFAHDYLAPFDTVTGQVVLAAIAGLMAAALWWMHRMSTPPARPGILRTPAKRASS